MDIPYSALLSVALGNDRHAIRDLSQKCESAGYAVNVRDIQRYRAGTSVPKLDVAIMLLRFLNYNISQDEVMESLRVGREQRKPLTRNMPSAIDYSISLRNFTTESLDEESVRLLIMKRAEEITGDPNNVSKYIENLIKDDLYLKDLK